MNQRRTFLIVLFCALFVHETFAQSPKREFRATWIATVQNIDWPSSKVTTTGNTTQINNQKNQLIAILDTLRAGNIHAVCLQVRPMTDAFYPSALSPWSAYLTGTRGKNPGYDPLAFAIEEAHKRGMELHAWFNPFRYETSAGSHGNVDIRAQHPSWLIAYNNGSFSGTILDPGIPEVRHYLKQVMGELIANYDIDGVIADDYFYPYGGTTTEDATSKAQYKPSNMTDGDWRRQNVNQTIKGLYDTIQAVKPWVRFGMAPFGIWTTKTTVAQANGISLPQGITGLDDYNAQFCDPIAWIKNGYIDYISPQLYWPTTSTGQNYNKLCQWWGQSVCKHFSDLLPNGKKVHLFVSQADYQDWSTVEEMSAEVDANRQYCPYDAPGSIFYNTNQYKKLVNGMKSARFPQKALPPAMDWKNHPTLAAPTNLSLSGTTLSWQHATADRFTVYVFPKGTDAAAAMNSSTYLVGIVYGKQVSLAGWGDLSTKTIAVCAFDRYGNEHAAALLNEGEPEPPVVTQDGNLSRVELWRKTAVELGVMSTDANRSIAYSNGHLYMSDGNNKKYYVLNAATGALEQIVDLPNQYFQWHNLRITEDGTMLLGNSGTGANYQYVYTSTIGGNNPENVETYNNAGFGRTDYFYPFGAFSSSGFALMLSNINHCALKMDYSAGEMGMSTVISHEDLPAGTSAKAIPVDGTRFLATVSGALPTMHSLATGAKIAGWTGTVTPEAVAVSGLGLFSLGGRLYLLLPADIQGAFDTYEITNGLPQATALLTTTTPLGSTANATMTIDFAVDIQGNDAYVYELAPNNGLAAYKYTFTPTTGVQQTTALAKASKHLTPDGLVIEVNGNIYNATGLRIN